MAKKNFDAGRKQMLAAAAARYLSVNEIAADKPEDAEGTLRVDAAKDRLTMTAALDRNRTLTKVSRTMFLTRGCQPSLAPVYLEADDYVGNVLRAAKYVEKMLGKIASLREKWPFGRPTIGQEACLMAVAGGFAVIRVFDGNRYNGVEYRDFDLSAGMSDKLNFNQAADVVDRIIQERKSAIDGAN